MKKYLIAGLLVWMPLGITFLVVRAIVDFLDRSLLLLPYAYQPDNLLGFHIPGFGVVLAVVMVLTTGIGVWSLAFMTSSDLGEVQEKTAGDVVSVFIPTTPNPTSGFVLMVQRSEVIEMDMTIEEGLKMIISMGVVVPKFNKDKLIKAANIDKP